jgi:hypothetical protein
MKGDFLFFGIKSTGRHEIQKQFLAEDELQEPFDEKVFNVF